MFDFQLFLAFPTNDSFINIDPFLFRTFVNDEGLYLQDLMYNNYRFLGKKLAEPLEVGDLESLGFHLLSLLQKLNPEHVYDPQSFVLLAIQND
ncbi:MAG: hypothetical protein LW832_02365 [Parachlamydia sp.]|jgi:hypothetical protein|nr:hypothetical protein [Parachlamydia sp.]